MKKVLYFAAVCAALVGCAKVEVREYVPDAKPIVFNSPVVGVPTKGIIDGTTYPTETAFKVWALYSEETPAGPKAAQDGSTESVYLDGVEFTHTSADAKEFWHNENAFWPKSSAGKLTFHAFSPATLATGTLTHTWAEISSDKTGFVLTDYTVDQTDIMYSDYAANKVKTDENEDAPYSGIDVSFHHALAVVRFEIKLARANANATYKFTSLDFYGEDTKGSFNENAVYNGAWNADHTPSWSVAASPVKRSAGSKLSTTVNANEAICVPAAAVLYANVEEYNAAKGTSLDASAFAALSEAEKTKTEAVVPLKLYNAEAGQFIVMPQGSVPTNAKIVVNYTEKIGEGATHDVTTGEIALTGLDAWAMGKRYTYTITIDFDQIRIDPAVTAWDDQAVAGPTI